MKSRLFRALVVCTALLAILTIASHADNTAQSLPFSQTWSNTGLITTVHDWNGVPGITGYRGDGLVSGTAKDPQAIVADGSTTPVNVLVNQTNPNTLTTGAVAEFHLANPVVALQGSGTASAPHIVITVSTTGWSNINLSYTLRDIDGAADNAVQPVALQYRVGTTGNYTNLPAGFVADASTGPSLATHVTPVSVNLPSAAAGQPVVQFRIITTDAAGSDEWIGIDDISVTGVVAVETAPGVSSATPAIGASNVAVNSSIVVNFSESVTAGPNAFDIQCPTGSVQSFAQSASPGSSFTLTPTSPLPSATTCTVSIRAADVTDTDANDPPDSMASDFVFWFTTGNPPPAGAANVRINEVDADTPGSDAAEFVELYDGGVGNTPLDGLALVFFNGNGDLSYAAFDLDGYTTDANGYFTIGNPGVPGVLLSFDPGGSGLLQNGADAVALYAGNATDFPNGSSLTTANLQDAVVYDNGQADDAGLLALLNAEQPQVNENGGGNATTESSQRCPNGSGGARNTSTYGQGTPTPGAVNTCPPPPAPNNSPIVISQLYGGGGNTEATYQRDYVELFNKGTTTVDITGWSLQYASASGSGWDFNKQPLGGTIGAGQYYLIALGSNGAVGAALPDANISGQINLSGTSGKVALVASFDALVGNCPTANVDLMDLVGYGTSADCREGTTTAPAPSNTLSIFRLGNGSTDTNSNGSDFVKGAPSPRRTAPIVELGPVVLSTDPRTNGSNAPRDATIQVTFTEPVDVVGAWFAISCASSGPHNSTTLAGGGQTHYITPNDNFQPGEQCTVTLVKSQIHDQDLDDSGAHTDTLPANYTWSFMVATGTTPPFPPSVHLTLGNPSGATASIGQPNDYLMEKPEFVLSYNRDFGRPNWVSWHLSPEWIGSLARFDTFRPDPAVPAEWYRVQAFDFSNSGFDRGHLVPNADRDKETSIPINQATFLMSNMVAQAPDNNQGPWASLENYLRTLLPANEIYIVAGGTGTGGTGSNGGVTTTLADGRVNVPAWTWKAALVIPAGGGDDISRVTCSTRTIAVILPNTQGIRNADWQTYLKSVDEVELLTGYDLFSNLPDLAEQCVEAGINGNNPKYEQSITFAPLDPRTYGEPDFTVGATASSDLAVGLSILSGPATISGGTVHLTGPGTVTIRASQPGNDNFKPALDVDRSFQVAKAGQTINFAAPPDRTYGAPPFMVSATGGSSGNAVTFVASGACTSGGLSGATITVVSAGACTITASQAGNELYDAAPSVTWTLTVNKAAPSLSGLSTLTIEAGTPTTTLGGAIGFGTLVPTGTVTITLNGMSQGVAVGPSGQFSASFVTAPLAPSATPYPVGYAYSGDANFTSASGAGSLKVVDTTPPSIGGVSASQSVLSPPSHDMIDITIAYRILEITPDPVCSLSVGSNEAVNGRGDGHTSEDWKILDENHVQLRAERAGGGSGRIYTITITCADSAGNTSTATTTVTVPK